MNDNVEKIDLNRVDWKSSREFFESLSEALNKLEDKDESYDFTWVGKRKSIIEAGAPIDKILRPDVEASKDFDNTKNMLIVGDNLDALKLLQESYLGKIKMIYIDPPYNTGHDFVYHDNFTVKKADFEDVSTDSDGNVIISEDEYAENSKANGRFHSDWLSMMYPRLKLARNLLTDDGMIFISIDDNEQANLKKLCDEVFGEDNFLGQIYNVNNLKGRSDDEFFATAGEYLLCYAKNSSEAKLLGLPPSEEYLKEFDKQDDISRYKEVSLQKTGKNNRRIDRPNMYFPIYYRESDKKFSLENFDGALEISPTPINNVDGRWRWGRETFNKNKDTELSARCVNGIWRIYVKMRDIVNGQTRTVRAKTVWIDPKFDTGSGGRVSQEIFGIKNIFDNPKPVALLKEILNISTEDGDVVLDFFAGSGTTGHAILDRNAEKNIKRNYILIQLAESTHEKSEARKAGYDTIDQITAERLRRAGEKIKSEHPEADIDTGFRVFRVDGSNNNENIRKPLGEINQSDMFDMIDNVKKDRTPLDLLFGVIYTSALPFDLKLETRKIGENTVYTYGYLDENTGLIACFDDEVPEETVKEIAKLNPLTAAFKDSSFKDSAEKINLSEHFRIISPDTRVKVI